MDIPLLFIINRGWNMNKEIINKADFDNGSIIILKATQELDNIITSLYRTGQKPFAEMLDIISIDIKNGYREMNNANSENLNQRLKDSQQVNINMMNALFTGLKLGKEEGFILVALASW